MTNNIVCKIIYKHYNALSNALRTAVDLNKDEITVLMSKKEIMELRAITILIYNYLTGEDLQKEP